MLLAGRLGRPVLINQQLEVYGAQPFVSVVLDVAGPGLALDVDDDSTNWTLEMHRHQGAQIAFGVLIRVVVAGETTTRVILDWSDIFDIGGILAFTRHPNGVHGVLFLVVDGLDVLLEVLGHVSGQVGGVVEEFRDPTVDLVQLQEYAGSALVVVVVVLQGAGAVLLDVHVADGPWRWQMGVITVVDVLSSAGNLTGCSVVLEEVVQCISPLLVVFLFGALVPDERTFDVVF